MNTFKNNLAQNDIKKKKGWEKIDIDIRFTDKKKKNNTNRKQQNQKKKKKPSAVVENTKQWVRFQVEYYFSLENLCRDVYLRKHMNQDGYIDLDILVGFNRLQQLVSYAFYLEHAPEKRMDSKWAREYVYSCLESSQIIELSKNQSKVLIRLANDWDKWLLPKNPVEDRLKKGTFPDSPKASSDATLQEDDIFQLDEMRENEIENDDLASISLITQRLSLETKTNLEKNEQVSEMINQGLLIYEKGLENPLNNIEKRFDFGETASSPPLGWVIDHQPFNLSSTNRSYKELTPFQHPSYELLKENGFIQRTYTKYHDKAIQEKGIGKSDEMKTLYRFWSNFLVDRFSRAMYEEFQSLALEDALAGDRYGFERLVTLYQNALEYRFSLEFFQDFQTHACKDYEQENTFGIEKLEQYLNLHSQDTMLKLDDLLSAETVAALQQFKNQKPIKN